MNLQQGCYFYVYNYLSLLSYCLFTLYFIYFTSFWLFILTWECPSVLTTIKFTETIIIIWSKSSITQLAFNADTLSIHQASMQTWVFFCSNHIFTFYMSLKQFQWVNYNSKQQMWGLKATGLAPTGYLSKYPVNLSETCEDMEPRN